MTFGGIPAADVDIDSSLVRALLLSQHPDLAGSALPLVKAPTLLIVGSKDAQVLELNRQAFAQMKAEKGLEIVMGASHLFEEPGTLEKAAGLARAWFLSKLGRR